MPRASILPRPYQARHFPIEVSRRYGFTIILLLIFLIALYLRFHKITSDSIWLDETYSWRQARLPFTEVISATATDMIPPLYNLLLHLWIGLCGDSPLALRAPSVIFGAANVLAIYWAGALLYDRFIGIAGAILLAYSGFHIWFSQEGRPYALFALLSTLYVPVVILALETRLRRWQFATAGLTAAILYTHPFGAMLFISIFAALSLTMFIDPRIDRRAYIECLLSQAIGAAVFLPWTVIMYSHYHYIVVNGFWIQKPSLSYILSMLTAISSGSAMGVVLAAGAGAALVSAFAPPSQARETRGIRRLAFYRHRLLVFSWLLGPFLLALAASLISTPILLDRYLICSLPAFFLLAAIGYARACRTDGRWIVLGAFLVATANLHFYQGRVREDFRDAVAAYAASSDPGDCVIVYREWIATPIYYYLRTMPACFYRADQVTDIRPWTLQSPRVWIFFGFTSQEEEIAVTTALAEHGWSYRQVPNWLIHLLVAQPAPAAEPTARPTGP